MNKAEKLLTAALMLIALNAAYGGNKFIHYCRQERIRLHLEPTKRTELRLTQERLGKAAGFLGYARDCGYVTDEQIRQAEQDSASYANRALYLKSAIERAEENSPELQYHKRRGAKPWTYVTDLFR